MSIHEIITSLGLICLALWIAFLPSYIAAKRQHDSALAVFVCNIIGLFTGVFWLVALVWAFAGNKKPSN